MPSPAPIDPDGIAHSAACGPLTYTPSPSGAAGIVTALVAPGLALVAPLGNAAVGIVSPPSTPTAPSIIVQPSSLTTHVGERAVLAVQADGTGPLTYVWKKDGTTVGGNSAVLNIASAQLSDSGDYTVTVMNGQGGVTSSIASLTVSQGMNLPTEGQIWPVKL